MRSITHVADDCDSKPSGREYAMTISGHVQKMLDAVLAIPVPDGFTITLRERHVLGDVFHDVTISPDGLDVSTFGFGTPGAYAYIKAHESRPHYYVGVFTTKVGCYVQSGAHAEEFATADVAVKCALSEVRAELERQQRGW
jgi:hypothetical protein